MSSRTSRCAVGYARSGPRHDAGGGERAASEAAADYYLMTDAAWKIFSKEEADLMARNTKGRIKIEKVVTDAAGTNNDVMHEHFNGGAPA